MLNMLDKIQTYLRHPLVRQLRDIRALGLIVFAAIVLLVSWSGVKAIQSNYKLEQQIAGLRQQNDLQRLQNDNQRLKNQYYNTPQYLELAARQNFGLAAPGEKELIVPKAVAMAHVSGISAISVDTAVPASGQQTSEARSHQPFYQRNMQAWMNFFLHRQAASI